MIDSKIFFGLLSLVFVALSGVPYIISVLRGKTRPHIFTWLLWGILSLIAAVGQEAGSAGPGAWATALSAVFSLVTFALTFSHGDTHITRLDLLALGVGLCGIPLWYVTSDPFWAVAIATLIDAAGYIPTFRKSQTKPHEEMIFSYVVSNIKHAAALAAISVYTATTTIYPAILFIMNSLLIAQLLWRRHVQSVTGAGS
jgi:hypothetical protein